MKTILSLFFILIPISVLSYPNPLIFTLPPTSGQLLVDIKVNNTTPSATDIFTYKIRYRYASTTENGTNSQIQLTFPSAYEIISKPLLGGNISSLVNTGNQYTISLESPSNLGLSLVH